MSPETVTAPDGVKAARVAAVGDRFVVTFGYAQTRRGPMDYTPGFEADYHTPGRAYKTEKRARVAAQRWAS